MKLKLLSFRLLATMIVALAFLMLPSQESFADSSTPLCFTAKSAGATVRFRFSNGVTIQTSRTNNGTDWTNYSSNATITLTNVGDKVYFRAATQHNLAFYGGGFFLSGTIEASGNIMSLFGPNCPNIPLPEGAFYQMFDNCTSLTTAPSLPATTMANSCYNSMFSRCTSLTTAPSLPATTMADYCYYQMFYNCTSLTTAPSLPATTMARACYYQMFSGCTSLTTAPSLPATTMANNCYNSMFYGCTSLTTAPSLPATTMAGYCYCQMFYNCTSLTTAPSLPATTMADGCYNSMFYGCTSLTTAPSLPATTMANSCYYSMFYGCTSLKVNTVPPGTEWVIPANANVSNATNWNTNMFSGTRGTFTGAPVKGQTYYIASDPNRPKYISASTNTPNWGTVTGGGNYAYGDTATLVAVPNTHYHLDHWSNGKTSQVIKVPAYGDSTLVATFAIDRFTITASPNDASLGTVTGSGEYDYGQTITLTATPKPYCHFVGWSNGETSQTISITVNSNVTLTANFAGNPYTISAISNDNSMGSVTGGGVYNFGTTVTLTAIPYPHYHFVNWSNGMTTPTITVTVTNDMTLTATFAGDAHNVTGVANDANMGIVNGSGIYNYGQVATLSAVANDHHHFVNWSNGSTSSTLSFTVISDTVMTANFAVNQHTISTVSNDNSMGNVTGGGVYNYGATVTLTANPYTHYHFVSWSNGMTTPTITVTVTNDMTLTATFAGNNHNVAGIANYANMGTVSGSGTYSYGQTATLRAIANDHYHFVNWSNGSTMSTLSFTVVSDTLLTANFASDQYMVTAYANDGVMGYVTGGGYYNYGATATLTAVPYNHYRFVSWSNGMTTPTINISVDGNESLTAFFEPELYYITAVANYSNRGTVTGSGPYQYGQTATLIATPNEGFRFDHWSNGLTNQVIYVVAESDSTITAVFEATGTGIDDVEDGNDIILAPNPVSAGEPIYITGDFTADDLDGMTIDVFNMDGVQVSHVALATSHVEIPGIDVSGTYIVRIVTGTDKVYAIKLIVK